MEKVPREKFFFENEVLTFLLLLIFFADEKMVITGEKEHAIALYMACRHLPSQLLCSPGERAGMLAEAAKILQKIGDQKSLNECKVLMKTLGISLQL